MSRFYRAFPRRASIRHSSPVAGGGGGGTDGQVGAYAGLDLATYPVYSVDLAEQDYATWGSVADDGGASETHNVGTWWDGGDFVRMFPPTTDDHGSGLGFFDLWNSGSLSIRRLNMRFEWRVGPEYCSRTNGALPKFIIVQTSRSLGGAVADRPMFFFHEMDSADNGAHNQADTLAMCPAQGTTQSWGVNGGGDTGTFYPNSVMPFYLADTAGTFNSRAVIDESEIITMEIRCCAVSSATWPNGLIAYKVYRRNGDVFYRYCPWNWDAAATIDASYIQDIQMMGGGYFNVAPAAHANLYTDMGGYVTFAANYGDTDGPLGDGWLGPRTGFVT